MRFLFPALAAALSLTSTATDVRAQRASEEGVARLLVRLETAVQRHDARAHAALLTDSADRGRAAEFFETELLPGMTRAIIQERDRVALAGTLPGNGYKVSLDVFQEYGNRARVSMWAVDVKRFAQADSDDWRIDDQVELGSVEDLYRLSLDATRQFSATDLLLVDGDLELKLIEGSVFVSDVDRGTTAMVFVGTGTMTFAPGPESEQTQVRIFSGQQSIETPFDAAFVRINPEGFGGLLSGGQLSPIPVDADAFRRADRVFREDSGKSYALDLGDLSRDAWSLLPAPREILAEIHTRRFDTLTYSRSPGSFEDISLFDRDRGKTIAQYSSRGDRLRSFDVAGTAFDVRHYDIDVTATPSKEWIEGQATLAIRVGDDPIGSLTLRLAEPLVVRSVFSSEYGRLFTVRLKGQDSVVVSLPVALQGGAEMNLTMAYAGRLEPQSLDSEALGDRGQAGTGDPFERPEPSFLYSSDSHWYPRPAANHFATARLRIIVPANLGCVASGEPDADSPVLLPEDESSPARKAYVFNAAAPLRYFAFVVSRFTAVESTEITFPVPRDSPPPERHPVEAGLTLAVEVNPGHARRGRELAERAADIAGFYQSILGDVPYPTFTVALVEGSRPGGHSPGYFAVVHEPPPALRFFAPRRDPASFDRFPDFFLAHELAHQWWGQAVGWRNYHEQWVSEGFSQYFAALYAQRGLSGAVGNDELFNGLLRHMRQWAMDEREAGPVSLGSRLGHIQGDGRIHRALVYNKGALVLHMLRQLVGDEIFFRGLRRFYDGSRFRSVGTDDFRQVMEGVSGRPLGRFFDQWIYGSALPRLDFSYRAEDASVVLAVEQMGEVFDIPLTVTLEYANGATADVILPVTERVVTMRVPLAAPLRNVTISRDAPPLADIVND